MAPDVSKNRVIFICSFETSERTHREDQEDWNPRQKILVVRSYKCSLGFGRRVYCGSLASLIDTKQNYISEKL